MSVGQVVVWGSFFLFAVGCVIFLSYFLWKTIQAIGFLLFDRGPQYDPHETDHQDALDFDDFQSACLCGAPRTDDHNKFVWRKHHGSTAEFWRDPPRPTDGLDKARW